MSWNWRRSLTAVSPCRSAAACLRPSRQVHTSPDASLPGQCHADDARSWHLSASPNHSLRSSTSSVVRNKSVGCCGSAEGGSTSEAEQAVTVCVSCHCTKVFLATALSTSTQHSRVKQLQYVTTIRCTKKAEQQIKTRHRASASTR